MCYKHGVNVATILEMAADGYPDRIAVGRRADGISYSDDASVRSRPDPTGCFRSGTSPERMATAIASRLECTSNFSNTCWMWVRTVFGETRRTSAISVRAIPVAM